MSERERIEALRHKWSGPVVGPNVDMREALDGWSRALDERDETQVEWGKSRVIAALMKRERDEARKHAREHHKEGGCLTRMATESERDRAIAEAAMLLRESSFVMPQPISTPLAAARRG